MKLETRACPECMAPARGTVERLAGVAEFTEQRHGSVEYSGYTDVWWDESETVRDDAGRLQLICPSGHTWFSQVEEPEATGTEPIT